MLTNVHKWGGAAEAAREMAGKVEGFKSSSSQITCGTHQHGTAGKAHRPRNRFLWHIGSYWFVLL